jgi:hypothetical protein
VTIHDPGLAAQLTVEVYGRDNGLDLRRQLASCRVANDFIVSADTNEHGLFWMSPQNIAQTIAALAAGGVRASPELFTNEILEEAYDGIRGL